MYETTQPYGQTNFCRYFLLRFTIFFDNEEVVYVKHIRAKRAPAFSIGKLDTFTHAYKTVLFVYVFKTAQTCNCD